LIGAAKLNRDIEFPASAVFPPPAARHPGLFPMISMTIATHLAWQLICHYSPILQAIDIAHIVE
jgi:hypothetical protein